MRASGTDGIETALHTMDVYEVREERRREGALEHPGTEGVHRGQEEINVANISMHDHVGNT